MIYLLEDDESIAKYVLYALKSTGFEAVGFSAPSEFWAAMKVRVPDLLLLDIMLPEEDGLQILKKIRENTTYAELPVIMITAKASEYDKVVGLDIGADDYVAKPFGTMELISRIRAVLRRTGKDRDEMREYRVGALYVCPAKHLVLVNGHEVNLTFKEFEMLCLLISNPGIVFSRDQLLERIWGYGYDGENRTVDVHIKTLRQKLASCGTLIETVRGLGYKMGGAKEHDEKAV